MENFTWRFIRRHPIRTNEHFTSEYSYLSRVFMQKELKVLKKQEAPGIDELPPGLLKDCVEIKTSAVPSVCEIAKITPVFKSGDSAKPGNH